VSDEPLYLLGADLPWWPRLRAASERAGTGDDRAAALRALVEAEAADPWTAVADALLFGAADAWRRAERAPGVRAALAHDVGVLSADLARFAEAEGRGADVPALAELAPAPDADVAELARRLRAGCDPGDVADRVIAYRRETGGGPLGRYRALRWDGVRLAGVARPVAPPLARLSGLEEQIEALATNTEAFLRGAPAMHALLYGPRGSGKSTVVRGLLGRYGDAGLRLVELPAEALRDLPAVVERLSDRPERFLLFVDDLAFEAGDAGYHPLKSLLEGSVAERPENVRLYATSNRRHLVQERLRDRPDPLDDDVHAWDTHHERLALADRFGLLVTFPSADRTRYLAIVRHVAERDGLRLGDLEVRADRFARAGNGYSGRTAQQFVDAARSGLA
jgi:predicted AAA+ superfamily ATPase